MSRLRFIATPVLLIIIALALVGCGRNTTMEYIPEGGSYALVEIEAVARSVNVTPLENVLPSDIPDTRQKYLTDLRGHGGEASRVADALTRDFPLDTAAVPLLVEAAEVDGRPVWLIVEAWAEEGGTLAHRRLWLLDRETLDLVDSMSFR